MRETTAFSFSRTVLLIALSAFSFALLATGAQAAPPSIESESVSGVTTANAVLEADIVPGDLEGDNEGLGGAWYQFQLVADPAEYWPEVTCPEEDPESEIAIQCLGSVWTPPQASAARRPGDLPTKKLSASYEPRSVSLDLQSVGVVLQPGTTYHYRVIAVEGTPEDWDTIRWNAPPVYGPDQTFTTPGLAPSLDPVVPPQVFGNPPVASPSGPVVKPRCKGRKKKASFRRLRIQCRQVAVKPRRR